MPEYEHSKLTSITWIAMVLAIIGALNWGLVGLFDFNVVSKIFGDMSALSRVIYVIVGLAGLYLIVDAARLREEHRGRRRATVTTGPGTPTYPR
jgi:uncharacterized membrane protein YuzA (DUF378 family)